MIDEVLERNKNKNSRAKAQRRREVRKDKRNFRGAARGKGKSWKIDVSRKGAESEAGC